MTNKRAYKGVQSNRQRIVECEHNTASRITLIDYLVIAQ